MMVLRSQSIISPFLSIVLFFPSLCWSESCSIFPLLNCSCFQSNIDRNFSLTQRFFSHLHCHAEHLTNKTFKSPFGSDFKRQTRFRTISLEFINQNRSEIHSNHFDPLAMLFVDTHDDAQIEIHLHFTGFNHITFHKHALSAAMFQRRHRNKRLWLNFIPARVNDTKTLSGEEVPVDVEEQFDFHQNCFSGLTLAQMTLYIHTIDDRFPSSFPFEHLFNHTNIGEVHLHGALISPGPPAVRRTFKGLVRSLTVHRHVDTIDARTFPHYSTVFSYTIHSMEAHSMDLSSFLISHTNLRGLELIKPRFQVSIDQIIPTLDSLTLDVEQLHARTLLGARHVHHLKLGSRLRTIDSQVFVPLTQRLRYFDLSDVDLLQMTPDSRCHLVQFVYTHKQQQHLTVVSPRMHNRSECDCAQRLFDDIQMHLNTKDTNNDLSCPKLCRFNDCPTISEHFRKKYPLFLDSEQQSDINFNETNNHDNIPNEQSPYIDLFSDPIDIDTSRFLLNQTRDEELNPTRTLPTTPMYDDIELDSIPIIDHDTHKPEPLQSSDILLFSWFSFLVGALIVVLIFLAIGITVFLVKRHQKRHVFKPVPVHV